MSVAVAMHRRTFVAALWGASASALLSRIRNAYAGGGGHGAGGCGGWTASNVEEEFLDLQPIGSDSIEPLSSFFSLRPEAVGDERFLVADDGGALVYADAGAFRVRTVKGTFEVPAPHGGRIVSDVLAARLMFQIHGADAYGGVVVADLGRGSAELWDDAYRLSHVVPSSSGIVLSHGRLSSDEGQLSLLVASMETRKILRTERPPAPLAVEGTSLAYFMGRDAFKLTLGGAEGPVRMGRLPQQPMSAMLTRSNLIATTNDGAWLLSSEGKVSPLVAEANPRFLISGRESIVVASSRRAWVMRGGGRTTVEAPYSNLNYVAPIAGTDDLLLCRGRSVLRYSSRSRRLERLGRGRERMKLRGAALVGTQLLTWSSRTWQLAEDGRCRVQEPPRVYLLD